MQPPIALTGLVLDTPLVPEMADFYRTSFGLADVGQEGGDVALGGQGALAPQVILHDAPTPRLGGLVFAMRDQAAVDRARADAVALDPVDAPRGGFTIRDPDGNRLTFDARAQATPAASGMPLFVSHVVLNSTEPARLVDFYTRQLGFTISDRYERDLLVFLRCDQPQHHCVGISPGETNGLNHFAMDCGDVDGVMRGIGRMARGGYQPVWGPGRHGPGGNVFAYFEDPTGFVPEFTADVLQIEDDAAWTAKEWQRIPENGNVWGTDGPSERVIALMSGAAFPSDRARAAS